MIDAGMVRNGSRIVKSITEARRRIESFFALPQEYLCTGVEERIIQGVNLTHLSLSSRTPKNKLTSCFRVVSHEKYFEVLSTLTNSQNPSPG